MDREDEFRSSTYGFIGKAKGKYLKERNKLYRNESRVTGFAKSNCRTIGMDLFSIQLIEKLNGKSHKK